MFRPFLNTILITQLIVFSGIGRIQKAMEKREYEKAYELILKGYEKEYENPGISYYHALLFSEQSFEKYNLDTARIAINRADSLYRNASEELIEDLEKEEITKQKIKVLSEKIRDRSFTITLENLSLESIRTFQRNFPNSIYDEILNFKNDSIDFKNAKDDQTQDALIKYIDLHPTSVFKLEADSILDGMRVAELEQKGNLKEYYAFLKEYPLTRHRVKLENYILKVSTASNKPSDYLSFIAFSQIPSLKKKATDICFFLDQFNSSIINDSIQSVRKLEQIALVPTVEDNHIHFYDTSGVIQIKHPFFSVPSDYKCQLVKDEWVFSNTSDTGGMITTKDGRIIIREAQDYRDLEAGIAMVMQNSEWWLYHKSGFKILEKPIQEATTIDKKWIKIQQNNQWGLVSFLGLPIAETRFDEIYKEGIFWVFERNGLKAVYTEDLILKEVEERGLSLEFKFDDIELVNKYSFIGFRDNRECLLDSTLNFLIPWGTYEIFPENSGWYLKSDRGYKLYNETEDEVVDNYYSHLETNAGWLAIKTDEDWMLLSRKNDALLKRGYDSIKLINDHAALLIKNEQSELYFLSGETIPVDGRKVQTFLSQPDYLSISDEKTNTLYNQNGNALISGKFEDVRFLNDTLLRVKIRKKYGLAHVNGDWILNPVFESLDEKDGLILTLIDGKIGCYDPIVNKLIATEYESRIEMINDYYLAKKDGKLGVIDVGKNEILPFKYDEIFQWNDSSYLVSLEKEFQVINKSEEMIYKPFQTITPILQNSDQTIYRFVRNGKYGLISSKYGELLAPEFTDIINISSAEKPFFFADQHLDKAGFHVVSYVNERGKLVFSKAYTKEEFEKILCDQ